jgi:RNA polymerase sigma-70 factor (family 1)
MTEKELINDDDLHLLKKQVAKGDQRAFRKIFDFFAPRLKQFAFSIVKTNDAASQIVDEVFIKIWSNKENSDTINNLKVYLYTATKNTALNYLSRKARQQITEPFDFINIELKDEQCPEQLLITSEIFGKIIAAVDELPPRCKIIFKLVREDGLKYKEVAEILNLSIKTVDAQMVIAVKKISEKVKIHFDLTPSFVKKIQ